MRRIDRDWFLLWIAVPLVLVLGIALIIRPTSGTSPRGRATLTPITISTASIPPCTAAWRPTVGESHAELKLLATRFVEDVGSWTGGPPGDPAARVRAAGYPAHLSDLAAPWVAQAPAATTTVRYAQLGGLANDRAVIIIVGCQRMGHDSGNVRVREIALDVRAVRADGRWQLTAIAVPPRPPAPRSEPGGPTPVGQAALHNARLELPDPARADIRDRRLADSILQVVAVLGDRWRLQVQVGVTGHPGTVFPTSRISNHAVGTAVDIVAIDGRAVTDIPRGEALLADVMTEAARAGATEVGGPVKIPGRGLFTDEVHQDHIHIGISAGRLPAAPA